MTPPDRQSAISCSSNTENAMLASNGHKIPPCGVPVSESSFAAGLGHDPGFEERVHQRQNAFVLHPPTHQLHQGGVVARVEAHLDVRVQHPLIALGAEPVNVGDRVLRLPPGPNP